MGRNAPVVVTSNAEITRIEHLTTQLPSQARVRITLHDGRIISGTVIERPIAQLFLDASGGEGFNGSVRVDDPQAPPWSADIWLSDIARIEHLDAS
jgi:hypothetical protein